MKKVLKQNQKVEDDLQGRRTRSECRNKSLSLLSQQEGKEKQNKNK